MTMFPGPVSKAITASGAAPAGIAVKFAMPPMFCKTRPRFGIGKQHVIEQRNERSALPAGQHVGGPEVRDDGNAERRSDRLRLARLPGAGKFPARIRFARG